MSETPTQARFNVYIKSNKSIRLVFLYFSSSVFLLYTYFSLQKRTTSGFTGSIISTFDSILDNNTTIYPYRIVYHPSHSDISYLIATCRKLSDGNSCWAWLEDNLLSTLHEFETSLEQLDYVLGKVNALVTKKYISGQNKLRNKNPSETASSKVGGFFQKLKNSKSLPENGSETASSSTSGPILTNVADTPKNQTTVPYNSSSHLIRTPSSNGSNSKDYQAAVLKFNQTFNMPEEEKLVNWYSCAYIENLMVWQGWMYLSQNHCCFYSYLLGKSKKIIIRWTDIKNLDRIETLLLPESIIIEIRNNQSMQNASKATGQSLKTSIKFSNFISDTKSVYNDLKRLIDQAMRSLIDHDHMNNTLDYNYLSSRGLTDSFNENLSFGQQMIHSGNILSNKLGDKFGDSNSSRMKLNQQGALKRQLDARAKSNRYIMYFRLPKNELLDGFVPCSLWLTYTTESLSNRKVIIF